MSFKYIFWFTISSLCCSHFVSGQSNPQFDIVLQGGRVVDPETSLDAIKNVGIRDGKIVEISSVMLLGKEVVDVSGKVVSPGFIDLHVHGRSNKEQEYQAHDGVTTALELEYGIEFLRDWYDSRNSKALINYGASVNWAFERFQAIKSEENTRKWEALKKSTASGDWHLETMLKHVRPSYVTTLSDDQISLTLSNIKNTLAEGALGIGVPIGYVPGANTEEIFRIYEMAGDMQVPVFTHVREGGIMAVQQTISDAVLTNAPLHIVHINSMVLGDIELAIEMVGKAKDRGFDISTEIYPYTAASTTLQSAFFDEGWQQRLGIGYNDLQWVATGERLTEKTFDVYRKEGGIVIIHMMKPEWIKIGIASNSTIIASDGMPYAKLAHPRTAGTFSRVLGKYVREDKTLSLMDAITKMTLLPARRLEKHVPMMRYKGRIQVGVDADITIFDPVEIMDKSTFENGLQFSEGIQYVLVGGVFIVKNGQTVRNTFPGQPIYGKYRK